MAGGMQMLLKEGTQNLCIPRLLRRVNAKMPGAGQNEFFFGCSGSLVKQVCIFRANNPISGTMHNQNRSGGNVGNSLPW